MTGLSWFQAWDLAEQGRAVRRGAWAKWLLIRFYQAIISEPDPTTGVEALRTALNTDLTSAEYLAKDWTDEVWTGGYYPPCTVTGPATEPAPNASGGAGGFTLIPGMCGGAGSGGGPPIVALTGVYDVGIGGGGSGTWTFGALLGRNLPPVNTYLTVGGGGYTNERIPSAWYDAPVPNGGSCWIGTPAVSFRFSVTLPSGSTPYDPTQSVVIYAAPPGHSLSGVPTSGDILSSGVPEAVSGVDVFGPFPAQDFVGGAIHDSAGSGAHFSTTQYYGYVGQYSGYYGAQPGPQMSVNNWANQWVDAHTFGIHAGPIDVVPGDTWSFRCICYTTSTGTILTHQDTSYTFAPAC